MWVHNLQSYKEGFDVASLPEYVFYAAPLLEESIDNRSVIRNKWGLEEVAEKRKHWMERLEFVVASYFELDSLTNLAQDNQVQDNRCSQQGVLCLDLKMRHNGLNKWKHETRTNKKERVSFL